MSLVNVISCSPGTGFNALGKGVDHDASDLDVGIASLAVRADALSQLPTADGAYTQLRVNSVGALHTVPAAPTIVGSSGNLFDGVSVTTPNTSSSNVDISACKFVNVLVTGSDTSSSAGFDVWLSVDGGITWCYATGIYPQANDSSGAALTTRSAVTGINVSGCNRIKLIAHVTETVTASVVG